MATAERRSNDPGRLRLSGSCSRSRSTAVLGTIRSSRKLASEIPAREVPSPYGHLRRTRLSMRRSAADVQTA